MQNLKDYADKRILREQDNLDWQREETENLILSVDRLKREEQQLQDKIKVKC